MSDFLVITRHHELVRRNIAEILPASLRELSTQLRDLRNNQKSFKPYCVRFSNKLNSCMQCFLHYVPSKVIWKEGVGSTPRTVCNHLKHIKQDEERERERERDTYYNVMWISSGLSSGFYNGFLCRPTDRPDRTQRDNRKAGQDKTVQDKA